MFGGDKNMTKTIRLHLDENLYEALARYTKENKRGDEISAITKQIIKRYLISKGYYTGE
jgi:hypothetical protein